MKRIFFVLPLILCLSTLISIVASEVAPPPMPLFPEESLLTVVLMVKDEEEVIAQTLQPLVDGGIDSFFIFDTGSTDKTMEITQAFFDKHGLTRTCIMQEPFINFAVSRNRALDLAEQVFPNTAFMLMPDAEWYVQNVEGLLKFCKQERYAHTSSYLMRLMHTTKDYYIARLIRSKCKSRFVGAVHEVIVPAIHTKVSSDVYFEWRTTSCGREKSRKRWLRDVELLLKSYKENKNDTRTLFYLGQTYACLDDWENAYLWYERRSRLHGWDEEDFITKYRLAQAAEQLSYTHDEYSWELAQQYYLDAHSMRFNRIEPLIKLADHYWSVGNYPACYLFAKRAIDLPYPKHDILFIEQEMYNYYRYEILSKCAWHVNEYALGEWGTRMALYAHPDYAHLRNNLNFYLNYNAKHSIHCAFN